jgi:hypothetical protein
MLLPALQVLGPRFDVLLTSYETVLKDKSELKKISYAVSSRPSGCRAGICISTQHLGSWGCVLCGRCSAWLKPISWASAHLNAMLSPSWHWNQVALLNVPGTLPSLVHVMCVCLRRR